MTVLEARLCSFILVGLFCATTASAQVSSLVKDISPGTDGSGPSTAVPLGNVSLFGANDGTTGFELWVSDGTAANTTLLMDILSGEGGGLFPSASIVTIGSTAFFVADDGQTGFELWKTDGTPTGTTLVKDIRPGLVGSEPILGTVLGGVLYFFASDGNAGLELWRSDGTAAGTTLVKDIRPGTPSGIQGAMVLAGSTLYFPAYDGTSGVELWKSDGTADGTILVKNIHPGAGHALPQSLVATGNTVYFIADDGSAGSELWKSDGTADGTALVKDILPGSASGLEGVTLIVAGNTLFFAANLGPEGEELWKSDGTADGTTLVRDIHPGAGSSSPMLLTPAGSSVFFFADDSVHGQELWKSDGTAGGTTLVKDIHPGAAGSGLPSGRGAFLQAFGEKVLFAADDGSAGVELWKSDGTERGTLLVEDLRSGSASSSPLWAVASGSALLVSQDDGASGAELRRLASWALDTTPPVLTLSAEGTQGANGYYVSNVTVAWSVSDADSPILDSSGCEAQSLSTDTPGTSFTCTVTSAGGTTVQRVVLKRDATPPLIACPAPVTAIALGQDSLPLSYPAATATDGPNPSPTVTYSKLSGTAFPLGATSITATATDAAGLSASCSFAVNVIQDQKAPSLTCPANILAEATGQDGSTVSYPSASTSDELDANPALQYSHPSGSTFPVGETAVTVTSRDASGNAAACSFTVTVTQGTSIPPPSSGCGCGADPASASSWWMLLALMLGGLRKGPGRTRRSS